MTPAVWIGKGRAAEGLPPRSKPPPSDRASVLRGRIERLRAELAAVENGTLPWLEGRADAPDRARTPNALARDTGISRPAANNRLKRLVNVGLATRRMVTLERGGAVFAYSVTDQETQADDLP